LHGLGQRLGPKAEADIPPLLPAGDQPGPLQGGQVLGHALAGNGQASRELSRRGRPFPGQPVDYLASGWIGQGGKKTDVGRSLRD